MRQQQEETSITVFRLDYHFLSLILAMEMSEMLVCQFLTIKCRLFSLESADTD